MANLVHTYACSICGTTFKGSTDEEARLLAEKHERRFPAPRFDYYIGQQLLILDYKEGLYQYKNVIVTITDCVSVFRSVSGHEPNYTLVYIGNNQAYEGGAYIPQDLLKRRFVKLI